MPGKKVYEYAFVRIVPRVERGEFLNTGVIVFCKSAHFLRMTYQIDRKRLLALAPDLDLEELSQYLAGWDHICEGDPKGGPIAQLGHPERFRWLTAAKSTILQTSCVHPGLCTQPESVLERLFAFYVQTP